MNAALFRLSHSRVQSFFRCRKQYWWDNLSGERPPPEIQTAAGIIGKGVHRAMKVLCETGEPEDGANELDAYLRMPAHAVAGPGTGEHRTAFSLFAAGCAAHQTIVSADRWAELDTWVASPRRGVTIQARLDRADQMAEDRFQVVDWKTGRFELDEVVDAQLDLGHLALRVVRHVPRTATVRAVAWNLRTGEQRVRELERRDAAATVQRYAGIAARIQATTAFEATPSPACGFCRWRPGCPDGNATDGGDRVEDEDEDAPEAKGDEAYGGGPA
ncbi:MAG: PD-(D/E)XK nuclease family protein [Dehalococcoidia bacterium]|nr:PD-(D/E)XK nuclease family protein [Dehalococcoidia bacterium]